MALRGETEDMRLSGGGSSSAMPHKQNPVAAERLVALARFNATLAGAMYHTQINEMERSGRRLDARMDDAFRRSVKPPAPACQRGNHARSNPFNRMGESRHEDSLSTQVCIIGAGPSGLLLGQLLQRHR
jgi:hypothetical protein